MIAAVTLEINVAKTLEINVAETLGGAVAEGEETATVTEGEEIAETLVAAGRRRRWE